MPHTHAKQFQLESDKERGEEIGYAILYTDKKENKIFLTSKESQSGAWLQSQI